MKYFLAFFILCGAFPLFAVDLQWDANPETNITGYWLHYGSTSGAQSEHLFVGDVTAAHVEDSALPNVDVVYFTVTAANSANLESGPSNEVAYTIPKAEPTPTPAPSSPQNLRIVNP